MDECEQKALKSEESSQARERRPLFDLRPTSPSSSTSSHPHIFKYIQGISSWMISISSVFKARGLTSLTTKRAAVLSISSSSSSPSSIRAISTTSSKCEENPSNKGSTSALDYKLQHRLRNLPPLPSLEPPTMMASEAVSNILYNTPAPSKQPFKRWVDSVEGGAGYR